MLPPPAVNEFPHLQTTFKMQKEYSEARGGTYGSTLAPKDILGQVMVTKGCLAGGIPLNALNNPVMKEALLHFGVKLPLATHLANHIPFIMEKKRGKRHVCSDDVMLFVGSRWDIKIAVVLCAAC